MRIACLQFAPQVGDVNNNLNRADAVLNKANPEDIDLLVLPELAFSGYNFKSLQHIAPFLEPSGSGISSLWARTTALKYDCIVALGYPEKVDVAEKWPTSPEYYNSAILVNGDGETIANYRKSFLYYTDETWALEGDGFFEGYVPGLGHMAMGICMDINPYRFEAPWHEFEFAFHILEHEANLVIISMAWLTREGQRPFSRMPKEPDMETLTYWVTRLEPVIRSENEDEIIVVFCNRSGTEAEAVYAGTSAVIGIKQGEVNIYGILGRGDKELLVVDTNNAPFAHLVYRPGDKHTADTTDLRRLTSDGGEHLPGAQQITLSPFVMEAAPAREPTPSPDHRRELSREQSSRQLNGIGKGRKSPPSDSYSERSARSFTSTMSVVSAKSRTSSKSSSSRTGGPKTGGFNNKPLAQTQPKPQPMPQIQTQPQLPKLNTRQEAIKSPQGERPSPKITIPVTDAHSGGGTIPTPTAPSPTPINLRPNFGMPTSARRARRAYNDDTPHPATAPLTDPWQIYGGHVSVKHEPFTSTTPFPDVEPPASPPYFWVPSDNLLKTPAVPQQPPELSSYSRSQRQLPNDVETPLTAIQERSGSNLDMSRRHGVPKRPTPHPNEVRNVNSSRLITHRSWQPSKSQQPAQGESLLDRPNPPVSEQPLPARPSSPKSRQASRQRGQERPVSAMGQQLDISLANERLAQATERPHSSMTTQRPGSAMATQRPASSMAIQRPGSAIASRRAGHSQSATPARPSSPKSRNASRSRGEIDPVVDQRLTNLSRASILIAASPSIYDDGEGRPRSASFQQDALDAIRACAESRNASFANRPASALGRCDRPPTQTVDRSDTPLMPVNFVDSDDRTISRGRQREPRYYPSERSHSANSTWPEVPQSRFPSPDRSALADEIVVEGTVSPNWPVHGAHHSPGEHTLDEIVAVEEAVSDNCPVHGSHSRPPHERRRTDSSSRRSDSTQARYQSNQRLESGRRGSTQRHDSGRRESTQRRESNRRHESNQRHPEQNQTQRHMPSQQHMFSQSKDSPKNSTSVETIATPAKSPANPQQEPSTPKAMVLFSEKDLFPMPSQLKDISKLVDPMLEIHSQLICRDRDDVQSHIHRPKNVVL